MAMNPLPGQPRGEPSKQQSFRLGADEITELERLSVMLDLTKSEVVRVALRVATRGALNKPTSKPRKGKTVVCLP